MSKAQVRQAQKLSGILAPDEGGHELNWESIYGDKIHLATYNSRTVDNRGILNENYVTMNEHIVSHTYSINIGPFSVGWDTMNWGIDANFDTPLLNVGLSGTIKDGFGVEAGHTDDQGITHGTEGSIRPGLGSVGTYIIWTGIAVLAF